MDSRPQAESLLATNRLPTRRTVGLAFLLAAAAAAALQLTLGDVNLNFADEGYLWYGVLAVLRGEVPFRDFQAYDPGRYGWCAALSPLFGSGIVGVRASVAAFQAIGLTSGLLVGRRFFRSDLALPFLVVPLCLWMFPRHKLFEPAIALILVHVVVRFLERPGRARVFQAGLAVGMAAFFGRNHGLYGSVALLFAFGLDSFTRPDPKRAKLFLAMAGGVVLGYLPMLLMLVLVPGFAGAFWYALAELASKGANIPKAYPWPWRTDFSAFQGWELAGELATSAAFLLPVLLVPLAALLSLRFVARAHRERIQPDADPTVAPLAPLAPRAALLGTTLLAAIYLHHVSVRSDVPHLGQCIAPAILLAVGLPTRTGSRAIAWPLFSLLTFFAILQNHTSLRWFSPWRSPALVEVEVAGGTMRLIRPQAAYVLGLQRDVASRLGPADEILIAPSRPTLYPVLGKTAPIHDIYLFWFASEAEQDAILERLEAGQTRFALIVDTAVDDREDLRFPKTYPRVWKYLVTNYHRVPTPNLRRDHLLFERNPRRDPR